MKISNGERANDTIDMNIREYFQNVKTVNYLEAITKRIRRRTKHKVYKNVIRSVATYAAETTCTTQKEEHELKGFERNIGIYGEKNLNNRVYRRLTNAKIEKILEGIEIVRRIKSQQLKWYGHINRQIEQ